MFLHPIQRAQRAARSFGTAAMMMMASAALAGQAQATTLTFATNTAPNNLRGIAETIFLEELAAQSDGEIEVIPYWGSSLMDGREILGGVREPHPAGVGDGVVETRRGPVNRESMRLRRAAVAEAAVDAGLAGLQTHDREAVHPRVQLGEHGPQHTAAAMRR